MGYWVAVKRVHEADAKHVYSYGREGAPDGHLTLDTGTNRIYFSDERGMPSAGAFVSVDGSVEERGELAVDAWSRFVEAAIGVMKGIKREGAPPAVADRVFG